MEPRRRILIVGASRWARVIAGVLLDSRREGLVLCSPNHSDRWREWLDTLEPEMAVRCELAVSLEDGLARQDVNATIIARRAKDHPATAEASIAAGKATMVEKPLAPSFPIASKLVELAEARDLLLVTGQVFSFASNIVRFAEAARSLGPMDEVEIAWGDAAGEVRYGEAKAYDPAIGIVQDHLPHAWSVLNGIGCDGEISHRATEISDGGARATVHMACGPTAIRLVLDRKAGRRVRRVAIRAASGEATLDFATEPGVATVGGVAVDVADGYASPLRRELACFLDNTANPRLDHPFVGWRAIAAIALSDAVQADVRAQQLAMIGQRLKTAAQVRSEPDLQYALREIVAPIVLTDDPGRSPDLDRLTDETALWLLGATGDPEIAAALAADTELVSLRARLAP